MKKLLLLAVVALLTSVSFSQARLGYTENEIREEFKQYEMSYGENRGFIFVKLTTAEVYFNFNEMGVCSSVYIKPVNLYSFQYYVNKYNEECLLLFENSWVNSSQGVNVYVDLLMSNDGTEFFHWHY